MTEIFNSTLELSLRALLLLQASCRPLTEEEITTADFIAVYGADFGVSDMNLHGDNTYRYCESATRNKKMDTALKDLALRGLIFLVLSSTTGFVFQISDSGEALCNCLESSYAKEYSEYSQRALQYISARGVKEIRAEILSKSQLNIRRDENA